MLLCCSRKLGTNFRSTSLIMLVKSSTHEGSVRGSAATESALQVDTNSYPRLCIRSPHADSIAATDSGSSCDFQLPATAERTKGLSLRVPRVRIHRLDSCFSRARILSGELSSIARRNASALELSSRNAQRSRNLARLTSTGTGLAFISS